MKSVRELDALKSFTCEHPVPGVILRRSQDQTLAIFSVLDGKVTTLDAWANCAKAAIEHWTDGKRCLLLHDFHWCGIFAFGAHMQQTFDELYLLRPGLQRQVAVVLPTYAGIDLAGQLTIKVRELAAPPGYPVHWQVFRRHQEALEWLLRARLSDKRLVQ